MELHAFDQMAQPLMGMSGVRMDSDAECCDGLMPQPTTKFPKETPPAMAYVPFQMWENVYDAEQGFHRGTMFPELDQPFHGTEGGCCE